VVEESFAGPHRFIDASVDPEAMQQYAEALTGGGEAIDRYVDAWSEEWERHANADPQPGIAGVNALC
jgi:hypothetical protein